MNILFTVPVGYNRDKYFPPKLMARLEALGEVIKNHEISGVGSFIFGFEESYGYLKGTYARDKDAVVASMLICEMCSYYKSKGMTLVDTLNSLYNKYGFMHNCQKSIVCEGMDGMDKMAASMNNLRENPPKKIGGSRVIKIMDYKTSLSTDIKTLKTEEIDMPKSNVLSYYMENGSQTLVRPSGTEPKIKIYIMSIGENLESAKAVSEKITDNMTKLLNL